MASPTLTVSRMDSGLLRQLGYTHLPTNRLPLERRSRAADPFCPLTCLFTGSTPGEDRVTGLKTQLLALSQQLLNGLGKRRLEVEELCPFGRDADSRHSWV